MSRYLFALGRFSFRRRWWVLGTWLAVLIGVALAFAGFRGQPSDNFTIPGTESQRAVEQLQQKLPAFGGAQTQITFAAPPGRTITDPALAPAIDQAMAGLATVPDIAAAAGPAQTRQISPDGRVGLGMVQWKAPLGEVTDAALGQLESAMKPAQNAGVRVEYAGGVYPGYKVSVPHLPEIIGIAVAFLILLITFGAVVAAGLPILTASIGVAIGALGIFVVSSFVEMPSASLSLALMLGLSCGIDYALFILNRYRNNLLLLMPRDEAAGLAVGTAGGAVVFAALTVIIALCGLAVVGIPFLTYMGLSAAVSVLIAMLIALTLLPALFGFAGGKVSKFIRTPLQPGRAKEVAQVAAYTPHRTMGAAWARFVVRFRKPLLLGGAAALVLIGLPSFGMHLGLPSGASQPESNTSRQAYDLTADHLGAGFTGPLLVVADLTGARDPRAAATVAANIAREDGVVTATPMAQDNGTAVIQVIPATGPNDPATADLVKRIRADRDAIDADTGATFLVGGTTASNIDTSDKLATALPIFVVVVVGLAFLLLTVAFRAALVPLTSIAGFLLSVFAALGVQVAVFQWGWGADLLGITPGETISFLPIIVLAIVFGLSSDYEVFVVSRIKEEYATAGDALTAVRNGVGLSARVVTAAALIMFGVFVAFLAGGDPIVKSVGLTLAVGVFLDAFVVRLTLIPAVMAMLGDRMWAHSKWFGRFVPDLDIEGTALEDKHRTPVPVS
ncbi:putative RND superfamily drug exporter [Mycolicibacterium chubuense NBB4]|uniref:Putative RND superfamily drug exporter n=1 Tax=Mycolicibacterium chubuense (strain NBB4) TaxID=710421 RepID=I4BE76_MYCCN|nr:MMPL family transporter [Mycolicibacterium chubuense]AFM15583.1 putative RND superfamily drug exporter [Mycolicibacterium chubuense NBB4]